MKKIRFKKRYLLLLSGLPVAFFLLLYILDILFPFPKEQLRYSDATEIQDKAGKTLMVFMNRQNEWHVPIALSQVTHDFKQAIISAEDKNFYRHCGIDFVAIFRAIGGNITGTRRFSGASSITMQTIRLLEPRPRNVVSKCIEAFRAWQIERILTKDQILELYINRTPYGGNLVGVEVASRKYFAKHAYELSLAEAALLAGLPQSPTSYLPDRYPKRVAQRRDYVLRRMLHDGQISQDQKATTSQETIRVAPSPGHFPALHFCQMAKQNFPNQAVVRTTLDRNIQAIAERALIVGLSAILKKEVETGAVVVVENKTGAIRALVGSSDFFSREIQGQINCATARRSPGSLLKPFTYGAAMDMGIVTPETVVSDTPLIHPEFRPLNYDRAFRGPVTIRTALRQSLNIPAVRIQEKIGTGVLCDVLRKSGLRSLNSSDKYGLTLTLGGCDCSLLEIVEAYSMLARLGIHQPVGLAVEDSENGGGRKELSENRILSSESAYMIAEILQDRGELESFGIHIPPSCPPFAWKTGTSSRHKDAWTVLYNPEYTIGVWMGNLDGRSSDSLVGIELAAPVACQIFAEIAVSYTWYKSPEGLKKRNVCAVSGDLPQNGLCQNVIQDWYIPGKSSEYSCRIHVCGYIDPEKGCLFCALCQKPNAQTKIFENWDVSTRAWLRQRGDRLLLPAHNPECPYAVSSDAITIVSPRDHSEYVLESPENRQFIHLQASSSSLSKLCWFENGIFIQEAKSDQPILYALKKGKYCLTCVDARGLEASVTISVR